MSASLSVRMYDVGFGDSFLFTFPAKGGRRPKVLVDCGVHSGGPGPVPIKKIVEAILEDVTEKGQPRIDLVIATHRHRDHVSGFEQAAWKDVRVDEVWMPWTEHPTDPDARVIREAQAKKAQKLALAFAHLDLPADEKQALQAVAENNLTNAKAMETLHAGFAGNPPRRFLPEKAGGPRSWKEDGLPFTTVHLLGPSRSQNVIRDMDPPPDESFLRAAALIEAGRSYSPFESRWHFSAAGPDFGTWWSKVARDRQEKSDDADEAGETTPLRLDDPLFTARWLDRLGLRHAELKAVEEKGQDDPFAAAVSLEAAVNGTSLMLMFEVGKAFLLLPGDAQWGTWHQALTDPEWGELLKKTSFYKVGHHGSHNATPRGFVEQDLSRFSAMVSTRLMPKWKLIPKKELMDALLAKSNAVVRSDQLSSLPSGFTKQGESWVETTIPV
jgi:beta-lactamase superfamily II metal-dependent hydrolase